MAARLRNVALLKRQTPDLIMWCTVYMPVHIQLGHHTWLAAASAPSLWSLSRSSVSDRDRADPNCMGLSVHHMLLQLAELSRLPTLAPSSSTLACSSTDNFFSCLQG